MHGDAPTPLPHHATRRALVLALLALLTSVTLSRAGCAPGSWWRGETTLFGRRRYAPRYPVSDAALRGVPFERVHGELLPAYLLDLQHIHAPSLSERAVARERAVRSLAALHRALGPERNLRALLDELDGLVRHDARLHGARLRWLAWAWNNYLDLRAIPYRLELRLSGVVGRSLLQFRVYTVRRTHQVTVGSQRYRARWLERVDRTNFREADLGHTSDAEEGALVLTDRVADLAMDRVWPLLDPALDARADTLTAAHAPFVRAEAARALSPAAFTVLASTARWRVALVEAARSIDARAACGSRTRVGRPPLLGFAPNAVDSARAYAARTVRDECPELLPEEVDDVARASEALRAVPALEDAVAELLTWVARAVAAHEARHAADDREFDGLRAPLRCARCGALDTVARAELSAFVASFAVLGLGRLAHYQACLLADDDASPHGQALRALQRVPGGAYCERPPPELYERARGWERLLFARDQPVRVPAVRPGRDLLP